MICMDGLSVGFASARAYTRYPWLSWRELEHSGRTVKAGGAGIGHLEVGDGRGLWLRPLTAS